MPLRAWGPCVRPAVACLRSGTSPWPAGNRFMASRRCARRRIAPGSRLRGCRRAGGRRRPRYAFVSHALAASSRAGAAYGCPGSGVGAPLLWCELGPVGPTCRSRWSGLGSGWIIGQGGGVWQRLRGGAGGNCANAGSARPRYVGRCGAPSHSGGRAPMRSSRRRRCRSTARLYTCRRYRGAPGAGKRSAPGASDRDPNGPRPLAGSGRRSRLERVPVGRRQKKGHGPLVGTETKRPRLGPRRRQQRDGPGCGGACWGDEAGCRFCRSVVRWEPVSCLCGNERSRRVHGRRAWVDISWAPAKTRFRPTQAPVAAGRGAE